MATETNADDGEKRTVSEAPTAAEVLHDLADHLAADLHAFADDVDAGDAAGSLVELDAEQARLLADALYQAASEK